MKKNAQRMKREKGIKIRVPFRLELSYESFRVKSRYECELSLYPLANILELAAMSANGLGGILQARLRSDNTDIAT